jgi:hypothetical protein
MVKHAGLKVAENTSATFRGHVLSAILDRLVETQWLIVLMSPYRSPEATPSGAS